MEDITNHKAAQQVPQRLILLTLDSFTEHFCYINVLCI